MPLRRLLVPLVRWAWIFCAGCAMLAPAADAAPRAGRVRPADPRRLVWSIGDPWGLPSSSDGQKRDRPMFANSPASCVAEQTAAQCTGGSGAVSFHVQRPDTMTVPAPEYRNMIVVQKWDPRKHYAFNYELVPNGTYDVRFRTINLMRDDAKDVQSMVWQNHAGDGSVNLALGLINRDGQHNAWFFNYGPTGLDANFWHGATTPGAVDDWEIQFRNSQDARGWVDMYRNGRRQVHYRGPVVKTTSYDVISFGIYYYNWQIARSKLLAQDITFSYFQLATIPAAVPPYGVVRRRAGSS